MIEQTVDELRDIALEADDAGGYFPAVYVRVTGDIAAGIRDHRFDDGERMERLIDAFAGHYIQARYAQIPVPRCWQAAWNAAADPNLVIVQHLLLGINAHVNHDLAQAIVEIAPHYGGLEALRDDFDAINDVLGGAFNDVIRDLDHVSRWASEAAMAGGGRLFNFSMGAARGRPGAPRSACTRWTRQAGGRTCATSTGWSRSWPTWSPDPCSPWDWPCGWRAGSNNKTPGP